MHTNLELILGCAGMLQSISLTAYATTCITAWVVSLKVAGVCLTHGLNRGSYFESLKGVLVQKCRGELNEARK